LFGQISLGPVLSRHVLAPSHVLRTFVAGRECRRGAESIEAARKSGLASITISSN
jgi:hypothetical protein